jgi:hypothetical protein
MADRGFIDDPEESEKAKRKVFIKLPPDERYSPRRYTRHNKRKKLVTYASYLWNKHHQEDKIRPGENIHHKDFDSLNDEISNLVKLTKGEHNLLHARHREEKESEGSDYQILPIRALSIRFIKYMNKHLGRNF